MSCAVNKHFAAPGNLRLHTFVREFLFSIPLRAEQDFFGRSAPGSGLGSCSAGRTILHAGGASAQGPLDPACHDLRCTPYGPSGHGSCGPACP